MFKKIIICYFFIAALGVIVSSQTFRGNPSQLQVKVDATGALLATATAITNPVTSVQFNNARLAVDTSGNLLITDGSAAGFAPANATYITETANSGLSAEFALASLATGLLVNTTTTGIPTVVSNVAANQVLTSGTPPAYSSTPIVTSITTSAGTGTGQVKSGGILCSNTAAVNNSAVQNTWATMTCSIPANTLVSTGQTLRIRASMTHSSSTDSRTWQIYWTASTATCSGTGATLCDSGVQLMAQTSAVASINWVYSGEVIRTGASTQNTDGLIAVTTSIANTNFSLGTQTETVAQQIVIGVRDTAASPQAAAGVIRSLTVYFDPI